ncbi:MAG: hypothetical protein GY809_15690 [Planctomycetes bacterium]|nr:hypothetical protein [Planctomycetota bacterium]
MTGRATVQTVWLQQGVIEAKGVTGQTAQRIGEIQDELTVEVCGFCLPHVLSQPRFGMGRFRSFGHEHDGTPGIRVGPLIVH